jgi:hypothetical protein
VPQPLLSHRTRWKALFEAARALHIGIPAFPLRPWILCNSWLWLWLPFGNSVLLTTHREQQRTSFRLYRCHLRWRMQRDICTGSLEQRPRHFDLGRQVNPITLGGASLYSESLGRESAGMVIVISSRRERIPSLA